MQTVILYFYAKNFQFLSVFTVALIVDCYAPVFFLLLVWCKWMMKIRCGF